MLKERYDQMKALAFPVQTEERMIELLINRLIEALYTPHEEYQFVRDTKRCYDLEIDDEPINWGDLKVNQVSKKGEDNIWDVWIDEASPDACPTFCAYIEKYMSKWGWQVSVQTEW